MRRGLILAVIAAGVAAGGFEMRLAAADTPVNGASPPPPPPGMAPPGMPPHGPGMMPPGGWEHGGPGMWPPRDEMFALFARVQNKDLTAADVRVIAQAILLEHGNHDWTVTNVAAAGGKIDFSYATRHGDVVATFSVDPATGRIERVS